MCRDSQAAVLPAVQAASLSPDMRSRILAVTNRSLCGGSFLGQVRRVCRFRPGGLILREKDLTEEEYEGLARQVMAICAQYRVPCILHSFPQAARRLGSTCIHLPLWQLRQEAAAGGALKGFQTIGASVHSPEEAIEAAALGATYLTAGHVYATDCKKGLPPRGTGFLRSLCAAVPTPVFGIGGIRLEAGQIREVLDCGAAGACIMSEMMRLQDTVAARNFTPHDIDALKGKRFLP